MERLGARCGDSDMSLEYSLSAELLLPELLFDAMNLILPLHFVWALARIFYEYGNTDL